MAKIDSKAAYDTFLASVLKNIPEDKRASVEETLRSAEVEKEASPFVMTRSDYSRSMDEVAKREAEANALKANNLEWYAQASTQLASTEAEKADLKRQLAEFEATHGPLTKDERRQASRLSPEDLEATLLTKVRKEMNANSLDGIKVMGILNDLSLDHRDTFKEKLDVEALGKFALERGLPLTVAYKELYADKFSDLASATHAKELERAREDGRKEALANLKFPAASTAAPSPIFTDPAKGRIDNDFERATKFRDSFVAHSQNAQ